MTGTEPIAVSGDQHVLDDGHVRIEVGSVGAVLREARVGGVRITETVPRDALPPGGCGIVLAPWPNRVRDARWTHAGEELRLAVTEPKSGCASHGLLRNTPYRLLAQRPGELELGALIAPQQGWPFALETRVVYAIEPDGIRVTHRARNLGAEPAPWAVGAHPYLRVGETPSEQLSVAIRGGSALELDERLLPVREVPVEGTALDLREPHPASQLELNTAYRVELDGDAARTEVARLTAPDGSATVLWQGPGMSWLQAYTFRGWPDEAGGGPRLAIALEPMSAAPDALNSGEGLVWIEPGAEHETSWGIRHLPAAETTGAAGADEEGAAR
ncbi:aldose 1-epimerase family protein [Homoserinibacter sp. YIM 151385]|uniref:aldose 1-epimerase family protein n=1 Tax=Homoserinibacter sp. YIM 151385 TaxID=2985506 RepID=UPI0022F02375|nr:aldose 1-epimerase family protein [Homoserinibacter sp. YIM 151385]WBU36737.1 aldose 1-epimerase family protein [Homoserinibacter sp. YIM 151385]